MHLLHALEHGLRTIKVDSDVIAIPVGAFFDLISAQPSADIWVAFGTGKNFRFYSINTICSSIGEPRARALPVFAATPHQHSEVGARSQHGRRMRRSLKHLPFWLHTPLSSGILTLTTSEN